MDDLKKHFQKNEKDMQVEVPDESRMWERIEARQKQRQPKRAVMAMRFAAAACILLLIGLGMQQWFADDTKPVERQEVVQGEKQAVKKPMLLQDTITNDAELLIATREKEKVHQQPLIIASAKKAQPLTDGYKQIIHFQLERLRHTPVYAETPEFFTEFSQQLQQMDADEAVLKKDIQTYGLNEQLTDALITIYQKKLSLLKSLQGEINTMNATIKKKETASEIQPYYLNL